MNHTFHSQPASCTGCFVHAFIGRINTVSRQLSSWFNRNAKALSPILLRVLMAYEFGEAGLEKLQGDNWFTDLSFPFPVNLLPADLSWTMATGLEIIAPIALLLGFFTRFFSAALMVLTVVAISAVHWPAEWHSLAELWRGYAITDQGYGNFKLPLMYLFMLGSLLLSGSGRLSVDDWLAENRRV